MNMANQKPDVLVIGGGNAALCAALTAAERGASAMLLESAPRALRGGNSRHTRNFRCMHNEPLGQLTGGYGERERAGGQASGRTGKRADRQAGGQASGRTGKRVDE